MCKQIFCWLAHYLVIGVYLVFLAGCCCGGAFVARRVVVIDSGVVVIGRTFKLSISLSLLLLLPLD